MTVRGKNRQLITYVMRDTNSSIKLKELHRRVHGLYNTVIFNGISPTLALDECLELFLTYINKPEIKELITELQVMAHDEKDEVSTGSFAMK